MPAGWGFTDSRIRRLKVFICLLYGDRLGIQDLIQQEVRKGLEVHSLFADGFLGMGLRRASILLLALPRACVPDRTRRQPTVSIPSFHSCLNRILGFFRLVYQASSVKKSIFSGGFRGELGAALTEQLVGHRF